MSIHERPMPGIIDSPTQQAMDDVRAGVTRDEEGNVVRRDPFAWQGFDPKAHPERERPATERTTYEPREVSLEQTLELWAANERGSLASVLSLRTGDDGKPRGDDALRAWEWVVSTPGYSESVRLVLRHLILRGKDWAAWPAAPPSPIGPLDVDGDFALCHWPQGAYCVYPFLTRTAAVRLWGPFVRSLRRHHEREPFTIEEQFFETR